MELGEKRAEGLKKFNLLAGKKTILIIGGSNGARMINESILEKLQNLVDAGVQVLWQTGKFYIEEVMEKAKCFNLENIRIREFLKEMDLAYAAADVVVSRAGALSIAELCLVGKPVIFIPSPNVAEDHQTKNANALVERDAAILIKDKDAKKELVTAALDLLNDSNRQATLSKNMKQLAKPNAAEEIAKEILKLVN